MSFYTVFLGPHEPMRPHEFMRLRLRYLRLWPSSIGRNAVTAAWEKSPCGRTLLGIKWACRKIKHASHCHSSAHPKTHLQIPNFIYFRHVLSSDSPVGHCSLGSFLSVVLSSLSICFWPVRRSVGRSELRLPTRRPASPLCNVGKCQFTISCQVCLQGRPHHVLT